MNESAANPMQAAAFLREETAAPGQHTQVSLSFGELVDRTRLREAWGRVAAAHPVLRTSFVKSAIGEVTARTADSGGTVWREVDWQSTAAAEIPANWELFQKADSIAPFDSGGLFRISEILLPGGATHYLLSFPGYLLDQASITRVLLDWLLALERELPAPPSPPSSSASSSAWTGLLKDSEGPLNLSPRPHGRGSATLSLGREAAAAFHAACKELDPASVIEALWGLVLRRLGATGNTTLRKFDARRSRAEAGFFENWLPVVHVWNSKSWIADFCGRISEAASHSWILPATAFAAGDRAGSPSTCPVGFAWSPASPNDVIHTALPRWINFDAKIHRKSPSLLLLEATSDLTFSLSGDVGGDARAAEILGLLAGLIESLPILLNKPCPQIPALPPPAVRTLKELSRGPEAPEAPENILAAFRSVASRHPDAIAVRDGDYELTFRELDSLSDRLAAHLAHASLAGGWHVALFLSPSSWIAIALIGSWKAGNACLALDPSSPPEWIESMLSSHDAGVVICDAASAPLLDTSTRRRIILDQDWEALETGESPGSQPTPETPAAVLPGHCDGAPPVVRALTHEMVTAAARAGAALLDFKPGDTLLAHSSAGGGAFFDEWLIPLLSGGTVCVADDELLDPALGKTTHLRLTAPEWNNQAARWSSTQETWESPLRAVVVEAGTPTARSLEVWNRHTGGQVKMLTFCSPAGLCGLGIAGSAVPEGELLSIGGPVQGCEAAVTDEDGHDLPPGFLGRLWFKYPAWKSHPDKHGRRGIDSGLLASRNATGRIVLEIPSAAPLQGMLAGLPVFDALQDESLVWVVAETEIPGAVRLPAWPLSRGGGIDKSLLPKPTRPSVRADSPREVAPAEPVVRAASAAPWVPVTVLQPEGTPSPLVLVPTVSGTPETYRDLVSALGTRRKILGLTARGVTRPEAAHGTIESAAAAWIDALLEEDPSLTFDLCGFGYGAIAALEMARQLAAARRTVPGLTLIGAPPPLCEAPTGWLASVKSVLKNLKTTPRIEPFAAIGEPARTHEAAWSRYRFAPGGVASARIILPSDFSPDAAPAWLDILPEAEIEHVKCTWAEMLSFPAVKRLASILGDD